MGQTAEHLREPVILRIRLREARQRRRRICGVLLRQVCVPKRQECVPGECRVNAFRQRQCFLEMVDRLRVVSSR